MLEFSIDMMILESLFLPYFFAGSFIKNSVPRFLLLDFAEERDGGKEKGAFGYFYQLSENGHSSLSRELSVQATRHEMFFPFCRLHFVFSVRHVFSAFRLFFDVQLPSDFGAPCGHPRCKFPLFASANVCTVVPVSLSF